ncbi:hypothetical protein CHF27_002950 [Romboutsia maritimum]|uniref:Uncharacterized protein n=1 Tax=Romboutsia maritimum TaxID=2020948 RepID=A0A371IV42_9FIRM|nr:hypothetical protein [Romboutsia maritimum]RDY24329.1 hypothetical protein CHF27_002950 [Romboutsia maritimum]
MEFHYYYLIQDIVGVMVGFVGIRMFALCIRMILSGKSSKNTILITIKYALVTISGVNLLINQFGLKPWMISIILIFISNIITPKTSNKVF